jgi:hypothetical protein
MDKQKKYTIDQCLNIDQKAESVERTDIDPKTRFISRVARDASGNAIINALSHGRSVTILQGNSIVEVHPDGRTDIIKKLKKSSVIPEKRVYHL